jgi:hypothetical protein
VLEDLLDTFNVKRDIALEFGVEYGYSTVALSNFFKIVIGVDTFEGDQNTLVRPPDFAEEVRALVSPYGNIHLVTSTWEKWAQVDDRDYDLIHIDMDHTYDQTFISGVWATLHAPVVLFHDTESFPSVKKACKEIADGTGKKFYNWPQCYGLGIIA